MTDFSHIRNDWEVLRRRIEAFQNHLRTRKTIAERFL